MITFGHIANLTSWAFETITFLLQMLRHLRPGYNHKIQIFGQKQISFVTDQDYLEYFINDEMFSANCENGNPNKDFKLVSSFTMK